MNWTDSIWDTLIDIVDYICEDHILDGQAGCYFISRNIKTNIVR